MNFACNTNDGSNVLVVSFVPNYDIPDVNGMSAALDLVSASCPMTPWWQFKNLGACRATALSANAIALPAQLSCADIWQGQAAASVASYLWGIDGDFRRSRILVELGTPTGWGEPVSADTEYYGVNLIIRNTSTVGAGSCTGCTDPMLIMLEEVVLRTIDSGTYRIQNPNVYNLAWWQNCVGDLCGPYPPSPCVTAALNRTWGQIKSIYR